MNSAEDRLIRALVARQKQLGAPNGAFAQRLGISRSLWVRLSTGERSVSLRLLRGALRAFPDLAALVLACLEEV